MEKEPQIERPKQYWETIRELEIKMFPEFQKEDIYGPENNSNFYFAPSWHFRNGLVTEADVNNFLTDNTKKLLSIGSGAAFLEKLLERLGIGRDNITLSDVDSRDLPQDFRSKTFDMWGEWSSLDNEQYDLIIFPESILINIRFEKDEQKQEGIYHLISQALQHLSPTGTIRMSIQLRDDWDIGAIENRFRQEGRKIKITLSNHLMEVKNETSPNSVYEVQEKVR